MLDAAGTAQTESWSGITGLLVLLFAATGFVGSLQNALDRIWQAPPAPGGIWAFVRSKLFSFSLILAAAFLLLVSLVLSTAMTALAGKATASLGLSETVVAVIIAAANFMLAALIFAAIFKYVPNAIVSWRAALGGGIFTAVLFAFGRLALAWYLGREAEASAYGAATSLVLLLIWVYYSAQILFLGAQFSQTLQYGERAAPLAIDSPAAQASQGRFCQHCDCIRSRCALGSISHQAFQPPRYSAGNASKAFLSNHCASVRFLVAACKRRHESRQRKRTTIAFLF